MSNDKELLAGFNAGYIIEQHQPQLAQKLSEAVEGVEEEFFQGFLEGIEEYGKERSRAMLISKLREDINAPLPSSKAIDKDKDIDIER